jgi:hypothetical protein
MIEYSIIARLTWIQSDVDLILFITYMYVKYLTVVNHIPRSLCWLIGKSPSLLPHQHLLI